MTTSQHTPADSEAIKLAPYSILMQSITVRIVDASSLKLDIQKYAAFIWNWAAQGHSRFPVRVHTCETAVFFFLTGPG